MTQDPKSPPQPAVSVEQCDRDAATSLAEWLSAAQKEWEGMAVWFDDDAPREFRSGKHDDHEFVQAFAIHRLSAAPPADGVPASFALVPIEPTDDMIGAALKDRRVLAVFPLHRITWLKGIWSAMLSAAQKAPTAPIGEAAVSAPGADGIRAALESALRALDTESTPIIRRLARIQIKAALADHAQGEGEKAS